MATGSRVVSRWTSDIAGNLAQQGRRDVPASVERHRRTAAVRMAVLAVGSSPANEGEAVTFQQALDVPRLQDRGRAHELRDLDGVGADKLRFEAGLAVFQQHRHYLSQIVE